MKCNLSIFDYRPDRNATNPQEFLKGFEGTIITDGYYGYNHIDGAVSYTHLFRIIR